MRCKAMREIAYRWNLPHPRGGLEMIFSTSDLARAFKHGGSSCHLRRPIGSSPLHLAAEVPAAVLAGMLHLAPSTNARRVEWAGGNWTSYVALRGAAGGAGPGGQR